MKRAYLKHIYSQTVMSDLIAKKVGRSGSFHRGIRTRDKVPGLPYIEMEAAVKNKGRRSGMRKDPQLQTIVCLTIKSSHHNICSYLGQLSVQSPGEQLCGVQSCFSPLCPPHVQWRPQERAEGTPPTDVNTQAPVRWVTWADGKHRPHLQGKCHTLRTGSRSEVCLTYLPRTTPQ